MVSARGFGIAGAVDHELTAELAHAAEESGYATFWANDTPTGDGLAALSAARRSTTSIRLGVGVIPIDRKPVTEILSHIRELELDQNRLIVGIGSGGLKQGAVERVRASALELRSVSNSRIVIGALGPRMCAIAGEAADGALLNWLTPEQLNASANTVESAARGAGRLHPWIGAYVRVALEGQGLERLRSEAERYEVFPAYAAHFKRMGVRAIDTSAAGTANAIQRKLRTFAGRANEIIVRAIAADESLNAYLTILHAAAPAGVQ